MDDPELITALRRGDDDAYATVFRTLYAGLVAAAERLLGDRASAEDVAQDGMLELWKRRDALPDDVSLRGYLYQSVRNRALNRLRHLRTAREAEPHVRPPSAAAPARTPGPPCAPRASPTRTSAPPAPPRPPTPAPSPASWRRRCARPSPTS